MSFYNPVYVTAAEVVENTSNAKLAAESTDFINKLIVKAQIIIDCYIWEIEPYAEDQDFKFPNSDNEIPKNVKQATVYTVETIYSELNKSRDWVKGEAWDGYSVSYVENVKSTSFEYITQASQDLLKEYGLWTSWKSAFSLNY